MAFYGREFATQVFLASLLLFSHPLILCCVLSRDPDVQFWFGGHGPMIAFLTPLLFLVIFLCHAEMKRPAKEGMYFSFLVPSALYFGLGFWLLFQSQNAYDQLISTECGHSLHNVMGGETAALEHAWKDARKFHSECLATLGESEHQIGIGECEGYEQVLDSVEGRRERWQYLEHLEHATGCAGWCGPGPHLWVPEWGDLVACSSVVADSMKGKLVFNAYQLMIYAVVVMFAGVIWMFNATPLFTLQKEQLNQRYTHWYVPQG